MAHSVRGHCLNLPIGNDATRKNITQKILRRCSFSRPAPASCRKSQLFLRNGHGPLVRETRGVKAAAARDHKKLARRLGPLHWRFMPHFGASSPYQYEAVIPPSIKKSMPVMNAPAGPINSAPTAPTSSGVPARPTGLRSIILRTELFEHEGGAVQIDGEDRRWRRLSR